MENMSEKDRVLWKIAKKRVAFRRHCATYLIMNAFFWAIWYLTAFSKEEHRGIPWPFFPMLGWGIGLAFHFFGAYVFHDNVSTIEKEYEKLKGK